MTIPLSRTRSRMSMRLAPVRSRCSMAKVTPPNVRGFMLACKHELQTRFYLFGGDLRSQIQDFRLASRDGRFQIVDERKSSIYNLKSLARETSAIAGACARRSGNTRR